MLARHQMPGRPKSFEHCTIPGCDKSHWALGFCRAHYNRNLRHGDPLASGSGKHKHRTTMTSVESALRYVGGECLPWPHSVNQYGYGLININKRSTLVSRLICTLAHGDMPEGKTDAAHSCGNPICVNPNHLRWATRKENHADKIIHGTVVRGANNGSAKLTNEDVMTIRAQPHRTGRDLAAEFGVSAAAIHHIRRHETWAWLDQVRDSK